MSKSAGSCVVGVWEHVGYECRVVGGGLEVIYEGMRSVLHMRIIYIYIYIFFFNDPATTEIYTLSLHDALPISPKFLRPIFGHIFIDFLIPICQKKLEPFAEKCVLTIFEFF